MDRIRIFNRRGALLTEFTASVERAWVIGERSTASFDVSIFENYCNETNLQFGNWLLVESDILPTWIGTIASREWSTRKVTIAAFSPEFLISQRIGSIEKVIKDSAGGIFSEIINQVNSAEPTILRTGVIYHGDTRQETINPTKLSEDLRRIYERSKEEYSWRAGFDIGGNLLVYGDWSKKLGIDTDFNLQEGSSGGNIEGTTRVLVEDAPDANYILGYGNGMTWTTRPISILSDPDSVNKYGMIQKSVSYSGVSTVGAISQNIQDEIKKTKLPANVYDVNALNVGDTFAYIRLGNFMNLKMQHVGFTTGGLGTEKRVRIIGMIYNPSSGNKIEIALEGQE